jgi:hypothetical protein
VPKVLAESPAAFVFIEDEDKLREIYAKDYKGRPVLFCENISDALKTVEILQALGKRVYLFADANVPDISYRDKKENTAHPLCAQLAAAGEKDKASAGVSLARLIAEGKVPGLGATDIGIVSAWNSKRLPKGVEEYDKLDLGLMRHQVRHAMHKKLAQAKDEKLDQTQQRGYN